ncbi:MAG: MFS transporter [Pseudanabaena sp. ELA645]|jgi:EmrB/QacA subfamily drug resistance transporter
MIHTLSQSQKWWATLGIGVSAFMIATEFYIVGAIIPILVDYFHTSFAIAQWIILIYTFVLTVLVLGVARLGDIYSKKTLFLGGLVLFIVSSLFCGLAPNISFLIAFRGLQGLGAVFVWALRNAIITEIFPEEERGSVLGWVTGLASLGLALGPGLGGLLIGFGGWRLVFWVNLPIGIFAIAIVMQSLPSFTIVNTTDIANAVSNKINNTSRPFDILGLFLMSLSLSCFVLAMTRIQELGFGDSLEIGLIGLSIIFLIWFLFLESSLEEPILDVKMFHLPHFSLNLLLFGMIYAVVGIIQLILPLFLELCLNYSPQKVGFLLTLLPLASVLVAPIAGTIADRFGERIVSLFGLLLLVIGCGTASTLNADSTTLGFCVRGILIELGSIISVIPISNTVMGTVNRDQLGIASGLLALSRSLGIIMGMCLLSTFFSVVTLSYVQTNNLSNLQPLTNADLAVTKMLDIGNAPVSALVAGIDATFTATTLITVGSIALASFLWWRSPYTK